VATSSFPSALLGVARRSWWVRGWARWNCLVGAWWSRPRVGKLREHSIEAFDVTITRSAGSDGAVVIFIDGAFGVDGNAPLRIIVNDEEHPVYAEAEHESWKTRDDAGWMREARDVRVTVHPKDIAYTGFVR
jgi:hypothetical protein